jgi:hypothetical protein
MNRAILSFLGCSGSIAGVLASGTIASPDTAKTIPYPEVMNLQQVPIFDAIGILPQPATTIDRNNLRSRYVSTRSISRVKPAPITVDVVSQAVREPTITSSNHDRLGDRNFAPTSMMVMGYSSPGLNAMYTIYPRTTMY